MRLSVIMQTPCSSPASFFLKSSYLHSVITKCSVNRQQEKLGLNDSQKVLAINLLTELHDSPMHSKGRRHSGTEGICRCQRADKVLEDHSRLISVISPASFPALKMPILRTFIHVRNSCIVLHIYSTYEELEMSLAAGLQLK